MAVRLEKEAFTGGVLGILVKWLSDMKMELSQVGSAWNSNQMAIGHENGAFTGGILGILVKWPFDLQRELSQVESVEF